MYKHSQRLALRQPYKLRKSLRSSWLKASQMPGNLGTSRRHVLSICMPPVSSALYKTHTGPWVSFSSGSRVGSPCPIIKTNVKTTKRHAKSHFHLPNKRRTASLVPAGRCQVPVIFTSCFVISQHNFTLLSRFYLSVDTRHFCLPL